MTTHDKNIFGHSWDDIKSMQQGTFKRETIDLSKVSTKAATENDYKLLDEYGVDGLVEKQFFGVLDRLNLWPHQ